MKKAFLFFYINMFAMPVYALPTKASIFAEQQYANQTGNKKVHIVVKKEHKQGFVHPLCKNLTNTVIYGYGDMKIKGYKKCRITYIVYLDLCNKPIVSFIIPFK